MKSVRRVRNHRPEFSKYKRVGFFGFLFGVILWFGAILFFLAVAYVSWFQLSLANVLQALFKKPFIIPFWLAVAVTIFFFPVTLIVILVNTLLDAAK